MVVVSGSLDLSTKVFCDNRVFAGAMSVRIKLPSILQEMGCGTEVCEVTGQTVGECIKSLEMRFPNIKNQLFDRQGKLLRIFGIYLKSNGIRPVDLDTPVQENDELIILSFIMGG